MLSALILSQLSYPAMLLAEQLVNQRLVHPGPLVLGTTPFKIRRLWKIETDLSHDGLTYNSIISNGMDYNLST